MGRVRVGRNQGHGTRARRRLNDFVAETLKYLLPWHRRAVERDIQEELSSLAALAEPGSPQQPDAGSRGRPRGVGLALAGTALAGPALRRTDPRARHPALPPSRCCRSGSASVPTVPCSASRMECCYGHSLCPGRAYYITVGSTSPRDTSNTLPAMSYRDFVDVRDRSTSFEGLAAFTNVTAGFSTGSGALPHTKYWQAGYR